MTKKDLSKVIEAYSKAMPKRQLLTITITSAIKKVPKKNDDSLITLFDGPPTIGRVTIIRKDQQNTRRTLQDSKVVPFVAKQIDIPTGDIYAVEYICGKQITEHKLELQSGSSSPINNVPQLLSGENTEPEKAKSSEPNQTPSKEEPKESPLKAEPKNIPIKEKPTKSPTEEETKHSPMKEETKKSPLKEVPKDEIPIKREPTKIPSKEEPKQTPMKEELKEGPLKEVPKDEFPIKREPTKTPSKEKLNEAQLKEEPNKSDEPNKEMPKKEEAIEKEVITPEAQTEDKKAEDIKTAEGSDTAQNLLEQSTESNVKTDPTQAENLSKNVGSSSAPSKPPVIIGSVELKPSETVKCTDFNLQTGFR